MQQPRTRGLETIQWLIQVAFLPVLFVGMVPLYQLVRPTLLVGQINFPLYLLTIFVAALIFFGFGRENGLELRDFKWVSALRRTNLEAAALAFCVFAVAVATKDKAISRVFLATYLVVAWGSLLLMNRYLPGFMSRRIFNARETVRTVLVGSPRLAERLKDWSQWQAAIGIEILGLVSFSESEQAPEGLKPLGLVENLESVIKQYNVDQVVVLESKDSLGWVTFITRLAELYGCRILIYNQWEEYFEQPLIPVIEGSHTFFTFIDEPLENPINRFFKRLLDIAVSIPVVLFLLPLILVIAKIKQRRESPGPLFFKQERGGRRGRPFPVYKIRTMHTGNPDETKQASKDDPRLYPFGAFMRRASLDEFPQFINVLLGQMSVVGPRPHMMQHDEQFARIVDLYRTRHFVKPGITGLAQVRGFRGEVSQPELIAERIRYDLEYINRWSIWLDVGIIAQTFLQIFVPPKSAH